MATDEKMIRTSLLVRDFYLNDPSKPHFSQKRKIYKHLMSTVLSGFRMVEMLYLNCFMEPLLKLLPIMTGNNNIQKIKRITEDSLSPFESAPEVRSM